MNANVFRTTDLPLATYLKCKGMLLASDYDVNTQEWVFDDITGCKQLALTMSNGDAAVKVLEYEMHRKNLLSLAKRKRNEGGR